MEAPGEAPHKVAAKGTKSGIDALKKLPPWAWILIAGGLIIAVIYLRKSQEASATASTSASGSSDATGYDPNANNPYDNNEDPYTQYSTSGYDTGYEQGLQDSGMLGGGGLGAGSAGGTIIPAATGAPDYTAALTGISNALTSLATEPQTGVLSAPAATLPTGGGLSNTTTATHTGLSKLTSAQAKAGDIALKSGPTKPTAPKGYTVKGTGSGNWIAVKNPAPKPAPKKTVAKKPAKKPAPKKTTTKKK